MGEPSTQPEPRRFRDIHPDDVVSAMMLLFRVLLLALFLGQIAHGRIGGPDVERFRTIALHAGTPWRDFPVEYAPLQALIVRLVFGASLHTDATILAMIAWAADLATFSVLRIAWGRRAGLLYLLLGLPLLGFIYQRIDLVPVALAVTGLGLARRGREGAGGVSIAAGVLFKLWPAVLLPAFIIDQRKRALRWALAILVAGSLSWVFVGGLHAPEQVSSFRGASGWQEESAIGSIVFLATGGPERHESGAVRVGRIPWWAPPVLAILTAVALTTIWFRAARRGGDTAGAPSLVAVCAVLLLSPIFSIQCATWILPWGAIAGAERRRTSVLASVFGVTLLTGALDSLRNAAAASGLVLGWMGLLRNVLLVVVIAAWWREPRGSEQDPIDL